MLHSRTKDHNLDVLNRLGVNWYLDLESDMSQIPDGARKVPYLRIPTSENLWKSTSLVRPDRVDVLTDEERASMGFLTSSELRSMGQANPGSYWYLFGEPNRYSDTGGVPYMTGTRFAPVFHYYATELTAGDPSAMILSPSVLNWDFTCIGCGGYELGKVWAKEFVEAYEAKYGLKPPVDVWAIDTYPIDWLNLPNNDPEKLAFYIPGGGLAKHSAIATQQLVAMRQYLDSVGHSDTPIWITEIAVHVGFDGYSIANGLFSPVGVYHWDLMSNYMIEVLDWLDLHATEYNVEKWFFYKTWRDIFGESSDGFMGISLLSDSAMGTAPNCLGETYRTRSLDLAQKLKCDADGNTVSAE